MRTTCDSQSRQSGGGAGVDAVGDGKMGLSLNEVKTRLCDGRQESFRFWATSSDRKCTNSQDVAIWPRSHRRRASSGRRRMCVKSFALESGSMGRSREATDRHSAGWANYFSIGTRWPAYQAIERYVEERARHFLRRRHRSCREGTGDSHPRSSMTRWARSHGAFVRGAPA